jgi:hypothetical protein
MSHTTLTKSLSECVTALRAGQTAGSPPDRLPPPAARSVLVEVLLAEFGATLPEPFAARVRTADSPGTAIDWMFAAAVYRAVADDPFLAKQFLARVDSDPRAVGIAMATALASKQEPPRRDAAWHHVDWAGLFLQLSAAAIILVARWLLLIPLASLVRPSVMTASLTSNMGEWFGPGRLTGLRASEVTVSILLTMAAVWLCLEAVVVPRLLEWLRQLPARRRGFPPPLAWRTDTFYVLRYVQAMAVLLVVEAALFITLGRMAFFSTLSVIHWTTVIGMALVGAGALGLAVDLARATLSLGTNLNAKSI